MGGSGDWYSLDSRGSKLPKSCSQASCWALPGLNLGAIAEILRSYLYAKIDHQVLLRARAKRVPLCVLRKPAPGRRLARGFLELTAQQIRALIAEKELMEVNDGEDA